MHQSNLFTRNNALMFGNKQNRQSPALTHPLPDFTAPSGARGQDIMIIWDMQNVRIPTELEPVDVIRFLYNTFVMQPGPRRCAGAFCTFTDNTKKAIGEKRFNQFCSNGVLNFMMINSPGGPRKADDSDHPLKEMMMNFTVDCVRGHKDGVLLLITADADFVRPAIWCKQQGCVSLELLYYDPIASKEIRQLEATWKMEWRDFLDCSVGRRCAWTFPYPQDVAAGLVPSPSAANSSNSGYYGSSPIGHSNNNHGGYSHRPSMDRSRQDYHQQQHPVVAGYLPAPQRRLALPSPVTQATAAAATAGRQQQPAAAAASSGAVQVSTAHVQQAAAQLLHNPAALHQVVQQYKQSVQTTAVLQQVLQGVAQAATVNVGISPPAAAAMATASRPTAAAREAVSGLRAQAIPVQQQQQQQRSTAGGSSAHNTPVKQHPVQEYSARPLSGSIGTSSAAASKTTAAAGGGGGPTGLTWQQLEQQQNGAAGRVGGFGDDTAAGAAGGGQRGKSPLGPQWWTSPTNAPGSSSTGKTSRLQQQQQQRSDDSSTVVGWDRKVTKYRPDGWASEEEDEGFWDCVASPESNKADNTRSAASSHEASNRSEVPGATSAAGSSTAATAAAARSALPPAPSMGLLKRAGGPAAVGSSTGMSRGSSGALAALLAGAAAKAGMGSSSNAASSTDLKQMYERQDLATTNAAATFSSNRQSVLDQVQVDQQQQQQPRKLLARAASPGLNSRYLGEQQQQQPQQRIGHVYDRHQHHHDLQIALLERKKLAEQQQQQEEAVVPTGPAEGIQELQQQQSEESEDDGLDELERALLQRKRMAAAAAAAAAQSGATTQEDFSESSSKTKRALEPQMVAAAKMFQKASVAAAAAATTGPHNAGAAAAAPGSSSHVGSVVVLAAPPPPAWMVSQQQQQQQHYNAAVPEQQQQDSMKGDCVSQAPQSSDGAEQDSSESCLIDEETGEVIILQPKKPTGSSSSRGSATAAYSSDNAATAAAAPAAAVGAVRPHHVRVTDTDMAAAAPCEGSSSKGSNSSSRLLGHHDSSLFSPALTDPAAAVGGGAAFKDDSSSSSGSGSCPQSVSSPGGSQSVSRCSSTAAGAAAAAGLLGDDITTCHFDECDKTHIETDVSGDIGCTAAAAVGECSQSVQQSVRLNIVVSASEDEEQQQQPLVAVELSVEGNKDIAAVAARASDSSLNDDDGDQPAACIADLVLDRNTDLEREISAAAAAALAAAALAASPEELLEELEGQQQADESADSTTAVDLDDIPIPRHHNHDDLLGSSLIKPDDQDQGLADQDEGLLDVADLNPTVGCTEELPGFSSSSVAGSTGFVPLQADRDDFVATLVRKVSGGVTSVTAAMDLDLQTLEEIAAARSAASADLMAAAAATDRHDCDQPDESPSPLDSPAYGLETLDLHGEPIVHTSGPVELHDEDRFYHDHDLCTSLGIQCPITSSSIASAGFDLPFGMGRDVLPIPMPVIQPAGFSGPSGFGSGGAGLRAASPVTAIEELGDASSESGSSRASKEEAGTGHSTIEEGEAGGCSNAGAVAETQL